MKIEGAHSNNLKLNIDSKGGEMTLYTNSGLPVIWDGDPEIWDEHIPFYFPWTGKIADGWFEYEGQRYEAPEENGFFKDQTFENADWASGRNFKTTIETWVKLEWPEGDERWPWKFWLNRGYEMATAHVEGKEDFDYISCFAGLYNRAEKEMPAQGGFCPALCCPFLPDTKLEEYQIRLESGKIIPVEPRMFDDGEIDCSGEGTRIWLEHKATGRYIEVDHEGYKKGRGFANASLWSKPGIPGFLCVKVWDGAPSDSHDLSERPGAIGVGHYGHSWKITIRTNLK